MLRRRSANGLCDHHFAAVALSLEGDNKRREMIERLFRWLNRSAVYVSTCLRDRREFGCDALIALNVFEGVGLAGWCRDRPREGLEDKCGILCAVKYAKMNQLIV